MTAVGGTAELARKLNISRSAVHQWTKIPVERVLQIETITGIPRHEQRPDIYPPPDAQPGD